MTNRKKNYRRLPKSVRIYIRRQKALIRLRNQDQKEQNRLIEELYKRLNLGQLS